MTTMRGQPILRRTIVGLAATLSAAVTGVLIGSAMGVVEGNRMAPRMIARATGISAYLLLVLLVVLGLLLSHPSRTRVARPSPATRIRLHIVLAGLASVGQARLRAGGSGADRRVLGRRKRPAVRTLPVRATRLSRSVDVNRRPSGPIDMHIPRAGHRNMHADCAWRPSDASGSLAGPIGGDGRSVAAARLAEAL
jgi:preprotein translocase subunit SecG